MRNRDEWHAEMERNESTAADLREDFARERKESAAAEAGTHGTVKWFNEVKGFGYITADDSQNGYDELFAHFSQVPGGVLKEGQRVRFGTSVGPKGRQATNIEILDERKAAQEKLSEVACLNAYAQRVERQRDDLLAALVSLQQAYSNKHSPQHRAACLIEALTVIDKIKAAS